MQARRAGNTAEGCDATRVKTELALDKLSVVSSHMVFRLCPARHRNSVSVLYNVLQRLVRLLDS